MKRHVVLAKLKSLKPQLEARGVAHAGIFGSMSRDDAEPGSDIDIVVTPRPGATLGLLDLGAIQILLEEALAGARIDVVVEPVGREALSAAIARDRADAF